MNVKQTDKQLIKTLALKVILVAVLFVLSLLLFGTIANAVVGEKEMKFDRNVSTWVYKNFGESTVDFFTYFSHLGSGKFLIPVYILIVILLWRQNHVLSIHIGIVAITGIALSFFMKKVFQRARASVDIIQQIETFSFPSGHALSTFIFSSIMMYLLWRSRIPNTAKLLLSALVLVFLLTMGLSRIALRAHHPTDVIGAFCVGLFWVIFSLWLLNKFYPEKRSRPRS